MKNRKLSLLFLCILFALGFLLRIYKVSEIPPGITMDESSIGYNAFSVLKTGKDEYGKYFPVAFRSFADFKMPGYFYFTVPWIAIFGVSVFSLRITSIIFGTLTGLIIYLLVLKIFGEENRRLGLFVLAVYLLSPWSIIFSRGAFESNLAFFFLTSAIYLQVISLINKKMKYLFLSSIFYAFSVYSYHSEKVLAPMLFLAIYWCFNPPSRNSSIGKSGETETVFRFGRYQTVLPFGRISALTKRMFKIPQLSDNGSFNNKSDKDKIGWKKILAGFTLFCFLSFPQYSLFRLAAGNTRIKSTSIIKAEEINDILKNPKKLYPFVERQSSLYFAYFSPRNLFFDPDPLKTRAIPEVSTFYFWMVVPYFFGLYLLFKEKKQTRKLLFSLLIISPVPASITGDPFATLRGLPLLLPLSILIGLGIEKIYELFLSKKVFYIIFISLFFLSLSLLVRNLFFILPNEKYLEWNYGYKQLVEEMQKFPNTKFLFNDVIGDNYAEILFFMKYPPEKFQKEQNKIDLSRYYEEGDWKNTFKFGNIEVRPILWKTDVFQKQIIIADPLAISEDQAKEHFFQKMFTINAPNGKTVFNGYLTNPDIKKEDDRLKLDKKKI